MILQTVHQKKGFQIVWLFLKDFLKKQAGQRLSYQDPYYFSRIFRKVVVVSPTEYREQQDM